MLDLFGDYKKDDHLPPISETELSDAEVLKEAHALKKELKDKMLILGHHYQQDDIIEFADIRGDSLKLAQDASGIDKPFIVFCGVHFMAETADILTPADKSVILPDLRAGCSMADMANRDAIDKAWSYLTKCTDEKIVPVTYINCTAKLKAFVGENGGSICTSSNAESIIKWALDEGEKLLFFPDQHLTAHEHLAFGRHFGPIGGHPNKTHENVSEHPEIFEQSTLQSGGGVADEWHSDLTCEAEPSVMAIL